MPNSTPTSARPRESNASTTAQPQSALPVDLSKADMIRFGVVQDQEKLPSGVTFASDRLTKPRIAKSQIQTEKIVAILAHAGVQEIIPLATAPVIEQFEKIMNKVQIILDMRKLREKEEQEIKVREAEVAQ
jgi:DNA methyltransferase 1-associated protein 1